MIVKEIVDLLVLIHTRWYYHLESRIDDIRLLLSVLQQLSLGFIN
jgi:hypothetical protein